MRKQVIVVSRCDGRSQVEWKRNLVAHGDAREEK